MFTRTHKVLATAFSLTLLFSSCSNQPTERWKQGYVEGFNAQNSILLNPSAWEGEPSRQACAQIFSDLVFRYVPPEKIDADWMEGCIEGLEDYRAGEDPQYQSEDLENPPNTEP